MEKTNDAYIPVDLDEENELSDLEEHVLAGKSNKQLEKKGYNAELIKNLTALSKYLLDDNVKWYKKTLVAATIVYFVKPKNKLKNWDDFFDFLDNIGAIESAVRFLGREIEKYY
jgi:hypothetical protein